MRQDCGIFLENLTYTTKKKTLSEASRSLIPGPPEYEEGVLPSRRRKRSSRPNAISLRRCTLLPPRKTTLQRF